MHIKKRGKYWHIEGRIGGERIRQSLGTESKELAEQRKAKLELDLHQERVFGKQLEHPFSDALLRYARVQKRQSPRWFDNNTVCAVGECASCNDCARAPRAGDRSGPVPRHVSQRERLQDGL